MPVSRWSKRTDVVRGNRYDARWDQLARSGQNIHGEADFVDSYGPRSVLDAGCGTGRVAIELDRRNIDVVGVDLDETMLQTAREKAPDLNWVSGDLATIELDQTFDVAVLAGNVMIFVFPGSEKAVLSNVASQLTPRGVVIAGFEVNADGIGLVEYDSLMFEIGLQPAGRWSTWQRQPYQGQGYAVSAHRRPANLGRSLIHGESGE
ncbi:MAG: class I SAM-dependent methyltransferase [Actinomycetota bacterium]|nr:class I SAM-dependent methyltransferase [Actinomycetota bacterium]